MDKPDPTASDLVAQLGENASPRPWVTDYPESGTVSTLPENAPRFAQGVIFRSTGAPMPTEGKHNAALAVLAVNSLSPLLKALEGTGWCVKKNGMGSSFICDWDSCTRCKVLAGVRDAARKVLT